MNPSRTLMNSGDRMTQLTGSSRLLRAMNESATLGLLLDRGALTRGEIRELTGLSKPTISDVLRRLTANGLAVQVGQTTGGRGPNAEIYAANPAAGYAAAVSIRETRETPRAVLSGALCDLTGAVLAQSSAPVEFDEAGGPADAVSDAFTGLCRSARVDPREVRFVQVGLPGSYDPSAKVIRHIHMPGWDRPGLVDELTTRLGTTVAVENDVNLATIAERSRGVAGDCESFALLWFGEGLGLGVDLGGTLVRGARGGAGEIGYIPVGLAGDGPRTELQDLLGEGGVVALAARHGVPDATTAAAAVTAGTQGFLDELATRIAWGLESVAAIVDPALIVLGGDLARAGGAALADRVATALRDTSPLDATIEVTGVAGDPVLLGALDAALRAVRDTLIDTVRNAVSAA